MYTCINCGNKTNEPTANYAEGDTVVSSGSNNFDAMEYLHSKHSWISCPKCGSDDLEDDGRALDSTEEE